MGLFGKSKKEKAIEALRSQLGIDLYENGSYCSDKRKEYCVSILEGYSFVAVVNRKSNGRFVTKEWYLYDKSAGWIKKASLNRQQSIRLYFETKPYYIQDLLESQGGRLTPEQEDGCCLMICDEYISNYMTSRYLGFSVKVYDDVLWARGDGHTEATYMPHRSPPPREKTPEELARLDRLIDEVADLLMK